MKRRDFLQGTAALGSLVLSRPVFSSPIASPMEKPKVGVQHTTPFGENGVMLPDEGWRMWPDVKAAWQDDEIFLPEDVDLRKLPSNPPTGGWDTLDDHLGTQLTLPATVEQFHWGLTGFRPYKDEYKFETTDDEVKNGAYYGVSWWWREIEIPQRFVGKRVFLQVRA